MNVAPLTRLQPAGVDYAGRSRPGALVVGGLLLAVVIGGLSVLVHGEYVVAGLLGIAIAILSVASPSRFLLTVLALQVVVIPINDTILPSAVIELMGLTTDPVGLMNAMLLVIVAVHFVRKRRRPLLPVWQLPYAGLLVIGLAMIPFASTVGVGIKEWTRMGTPFAIGLLAADSVTSRRSAERLVKAVIFMSVVPLAVGLFQRAGLASGGYEDRISGTFGFANTFALYLLWLLVLAFPRMMLQPTFRERAISGVFSAVAGISLLLTGARAGFVGLLASMALTLTDRKGFLYGVVGVSAVGILVSSVPAFQERLIDATQYALSVSSEMRTNDAIGNRLYLWTEVLNAAGEPTPLGHGFGYTRSLVDSVYRGRISFVHNEYLRLYVDAGAAGVVLYALFLVLAAGRYCWLWVRLKEPQVKGLVLASGSSVVALAVFSASDNPLMYYNVLIFYWVLWGATNRLLHQN